MRWSLPLIVLAFACGPVDRDRSSAKPDASVRRDSGVPIMDAGPPGDCDLGLPSLGMVIDRGTGSDYLLEFERGDTKVAVARYYVEWGVGESQIFRNGGFSLSRDGVDLCATDEAKLDYVNSHHNWRDSAELVEGGVRYRLDLHYMFDQNALWTYNLSAFDATTGDELFGPEPLDLVSGPMWP